MLIEEVCTRWRELGCDRRWLPLKEFPWKGETNFRLSMMGSPYREEYSIIPQ